MATIPKDPAELMKQLKKLEMAGGKQGNNNRMLKLELQRMHVEGKLMEAEDYTFTDEGKRRMQRYNEEVQMNIEDEISNQAEILFRNEAKLNFRDKIRIEVELRQKKEAEERKEKKRIAEERRQMVIDRLRKQREEEERKIREEEERIQEEKDAVVRAEQYAKDMIKREKLKMACEDDLSKLYEQALKDAAELVAWKKEEAARMKLWEEQERLKDEEQERNKQQRLLELEAKKAKLAAMRKAQLDKAPAPTKVSIEQAREEANRLNKQLKIQNKAKFVTKKLKKKGSEADSDVLEPMTAGSMVDPSQITVNTSMEEALQAQQMPSDATENNVNVAVTAVKKQKQILKPLDDMANTVKLSGEFMAGICNMSEPELRTMSKDLMSEKRKLRLEQRQMMSSSMSVEGADDAKKKASSAKKKLKELMLKEEAVEKELLKKIAHEKATVMQSVKKSLSSLTLTATVADGKVLEISPVAELPLDASDLGASVVSDEAGDVLGSTVCLSEADTSQVSDVLGSTQPSPTRTDPTDEIGSPKVTQVKKFQTTYHAKDEVNDAYKHAEKILRQYTVVLSTFQLAPYAEIDIDIVKDVEKTNHDCSKKASVLELQIMSAVRALGRIAGSSASSGDDTSTVYMDKLMEAGRELRKISFKYNDWVKSIPPAPIVKPPTASSSAALPAVESPTAAPVTEEAPPLNAMQVLSDDHVAAAVVEPLLSPVKVVTEEVTQESAAGGVAVGEMKEKEVVDSLGEVGEVDEGKDEEPSFENIDGWDECLHTTMATAAHHAAFYGYAKVLDVLSKYFDCFVLDAKNRTPLFLAALKNHLDCVAILIAIDPQWIDVGDVNGDTPLHAAALSNGAQVLQFLLSCEVSPDTTNYAGLTPSHLAKTWNSLEVLYYASAQQYCVDAKSRMPLWLACQSGRAECVDFLCRVTPSEYLLWGDEDGTTPLHIAASNGHHKCIELLCQWMKKVEDMYVTNKQGHTAAHVAKNAAVLKTLYENGADMWILDPKGRYPLFAASFHGRIDCVAFLCELAMFADASTKQRKMECVAAKDNQGGDTCLHVACLKGHLQCVYLLLYCVRNVPNNKGIGADVLAHKAGHPVIAQLVAFTEKLRTSLSTEKIFGCRFDKMSVVFQKHGCRWTKYYDDTLDTVYYYDRITGQSRWERPVITPNSGAVDNYIYDEPPVDEKRNDKAREILKQFYTKYNPAKLKEMDKILGLYRGKYEDLFISLVERYEVEDLTMFAGVNLD